MKKISLMLLVLGVTALTACGASPASPAAEPAGGSSESAEAKETETPAQEAEPSAGIANPWRESSAEEAAELVPRLFKAPEGATDIYWQVMENPVKPEDNPLVEMDFTLDGMSFTARAKYGASQDEDISGMFYEWDNVESGTLSGWGGGNMEAKFYIASTEGETAELATWYDTEVGIAYSLSVAAPDLDGFDLQAVVEQLYSETSEEFMPSSFVEEKAGKGTFASYEELISLLESGQGYAYLELTGYDGKILAIAQNLYDDQEGHNASMEAYLYTEKNGEVTNAGNAFSNGTAYPIRFGGGLLYACGSHTYESNFISGETGGLMVKDYVSEDFDENGTATYTGFLRESNTFESDQDFTGGEAEFQALFDNYLKQEVLNFTKVE